VKLPRNLNPQWAQRNAPGCIFDEQARRTPQTVTTREAVFRRDALILLAP